jgi:hypothetical protein
MSIYSPATQRWLRRERRRFIIRRWRQAALLVLLLAVGLWGFSNYRADHFTFAWTKPVSVLLVAVVDPATDFVDDSRQNFLRRFLSSLPATEGNLAGVQKWFQNEREKWTGKTASPLELTTRGPIRAPGPPPEPPRPDASFLERWRKTGEFLDYFERIGAEERLLPEAYDVVLFVYFFDERELKKYSGQDSVATRRKKRGVVFSPLGPGHMTRCCALVAHELCHTLGATDKYQGERSVFPDGFAEPDRQPLYPQELAEIMALGIPEAQGVERRVEELTQCRIGKKTSEEIGWTSRKPSP